MPRRRPCRVVDLKVPINNSRRKDKRRLTLKSWRYTASKLWSSIPDDYRKLDNYNIFKRMLTELDYSTLDFWNIVYVYIDVRLNIGFITCFNL